MVILKKGQKMSYGIDITFYNAKPKSVINILSELSIITKEQFEKYLEENKPFIPSIRSCSHIENFDEYKEKWLDKDEAWLHKNAKRYVIYWKNMNLIGVIGNYDNLPHNKAYHVYFQNSCDQDYDFNEWPKLKLFRNIISEYIALPDNEIIKQGELENEDDVDKETIEYYRRYLVYRKIFEKLNMSDIIYNRESMQDDNITILTLSPFKSYYEACKYETRMPEFIRKYLHIKS